jgi:hypothetical protein
MSITTESRMNDLIQAGVLNLEDLEINRSGHLSQRQRHWLYLNISFWLALVVVDLIILPRLFTSRYFFKGIPLIGFLIILVVLCVRNAKPYWEDFRDDTPKTISGHVFKHFSTTYSRVPVGYCSIRVGNQVFSIAPSAYSAMWRRRITAYIFSKIPER